jgi:hypothetical protein
VGGAIRQLLGTQLLKEEHVALQRNLIASRGIPAPDGENVITGAKSAPHKKEEGGEMKEV